MKKLFFIIAVLLISTLNYAQPLVGMGVGHSTKAYVFNLQIGVKAGNSLVYYNQLIHLKAHSPVPNVPQIVGIRYGYTIGSFTPNIGADYWLLSSDLYKKDKPDEGFQFGYGLTYAFKSTPLKIDLAASGKIIFFTVTSYIEIE
ncbi:MAG: hypothetical protein H0V14_05815 [Chitinophagaceae bacterium]|jgi:hypothetical protein|nr:hypothetical protein [Chitinophagaceae bacterium]